MDYTKLRWSSDWNGYEVGYDDVPVVGYYTLVDFPNINVYIDTEKGKILEVWLDEEE